MLEKTIEDLLNDVAEDKCDNFSTTSFKFKTDLWNFFKELDGSSKFNCVEFGTHKGQTTRILSFLFERGMIYTINKPGHMDSALKLNADRENITYVEMDLYTQPIEDNFIHQPINAVFIDADHSTSAILTDFARSCNFKRSEPMYFVFDDYGLHSEVRYAVDQLLQFGNLEKVCYIGHEPRHSFGGRPERILTHHEGIICKLI